MIILLLLFAAPVFQIILSVLRICGRIATPLDIVALFAFILGIISTIAVMNSMTIELINSIEFGVSSKNHHGRCLDCGMVTVSVLVVGFLITLISTIVIGLISYLIYYFKTRSKAKNL